MTLKNLTSHIEDIKKSLNTELEQDTRENSKKSIVTIVFRENVPVWPLKIDISLFLVIFIHDFVQFFN